MVSNPKQIVEKILGRQISNEEWNRKWAKNPHIVNIKKAKAIGKDRKRRSDFVK